MATQYQCQNPLRRDRIRDINEKYQVILNGIDYLEVLDLEAPPGSPRQQTLLVHCLASAPDLFDASRVTIEGGVRIRNPKVLWAIAASKASTLSVLNAAEKQFFAGLDAPEKVLVVRTDARGDYSSYRLKIRPVDGDLPPFDSQLSEIEFSFKVECPSDFDCCTEQIASPEIAQEPVIDYLAKDYASFRRLMLDRLSVIMPEWKERHAADVGIALVEALAYAADHLSYYQDAVATEAYLETARGRISTRRHARLLDYRMHDGCNARVWVAMEVEKAADGTSLPGPDGFKPGTLLLTKTDAPGGSLNLSDDEVEKALESGALAFETMEDVQLFASRNEIYFHTWGNQGCVLASGATAATLRQEGRDSMISPDPTQGALKPGDVLIFEEVRSPVSGAEADADPGHRHAVRLLTVEYTKDDLDPVNPGSSIPVIQIAWAAQDALPFTLCLEDTEEGLPISVVRGNVVLADHGRTTATPEILPEVIAGTPYCPTLAGGPVTQQGRSRAPLNEPAVDENDRGRLFNPGAPAAAAMQWEMSDVLPAVCLQGEQGIDWFPQYDLLNSGRFAAEFVVETEEDGRARLRFGDGILGRLPVSGLKAIYRCGNGQYGNVGAEAIANVITNRKGVSEVRNPLPARGGREPETLDQVRFSAPQAFRTQQRAVTEADYAEIAGRHPEVQKAAATRRWTGSWHTMFVTIDRKGGRAVDENFREEMKLFLDRFRMAGYDLEVNAPVFVSLDIALTICVKSGYFQGNVKEALLEVFSNRDLPGGAKGFFHPDNFTFGQPVYLSRIIAAAMRVPGVHWVDADNAPPKLNRFQRWGRLAQKELEDGCIGMDRLEIARLDNDPSRPENGKIEFYMKGGM